MQPNKGKYKIVLIRYKILFQALAQSCQWRFLEIPYFKYGICIMDIGQYAKLAVKNLCSWKNVHLKSLYLVFTYKRFNFDLYSW